MGFPILCIDCDMRGLPGFLPGSPGSLVAANFSSMLDAGRIFPDVITLVNVYITMENHNFQWENSLFLWLFSIAMLVITQRVFEIL